MARVIQLPVEHREFFLKMYEDMVHLQSKHNHQRDIINGSSPNADEIIKHKREQYAVRSSRNTQ